jgi:rhamnulokinase
VEATALGNVLVQARAMGALRGDLAALRALLRATQSLTRYEPRGDETVWTEAEQRLERAPART